MFYLIIHFFYFSIFSYILKMNENNFYLSSKNGSLLFLKTIIQKQPKRL